MYIYARSYLFCTYVQVDAEDVAHADTVNMLPNSQLFTRQLEKIAVSARLEAPVTRRMHKWTCVFQTPPTGA